MRLWKYNFADDGAILVFLKYALYVALFPNVSLKYFSVQSRKFTIDRNGDHLNGDGKLIAVQRWVCTLNDWVGG